MATPSLDNLPTDLLTQLVDNHLVLQNLGLARINKRFRQIFFKHPLYFLALYIQAHKNNSPLPSLEGVRWHIKKDLFLARILIKIDKSLCGLHRFLSLPHNFEANPLLEKGVLKLMDSVKWIPHSLQMTAQNATIQHIAKENKALLEVIEEKLTWNERVVARIDWKVISSNAHLVKAGQLISCEKKLYKHLFSTVNPNFTTFYKNWEYARFLFKHISGEEFWANAFPILHREFPEKTEHDYIPLFKPSPLILIKHLNSLTHFPPIFEAAKRMEKKFGRENKSSVDLLSSYCSKLKSSLKNKKLSIPESSEEFIQLLKQGCCDLDSLRDAGVITRFNNDEAAMVALLKRFPYVQQKHFCRDLMTKPSFLLQLAKHQSFSFTNELQDNKDFLLKVLAIQPEFIFQVKERKEEYIKTALINDPWVYERLSYIEMNKYRSLFTSLIPPHSLHNRQAVEPTDELL